MTLTPSTKNSLFVGLGAIVLVGTIGGVLFVHNRRVALQNLSRPRVAPADMPTEFKVQKEQESLEKIKRLRALWREHWASKHKLLLLTMMNARSGEDSAWMNVTAQIPPANKSKLGFDINTPEEQNWRNRGNPDYVVAGWNPGWPVKPARPELAEQAQRISDAQKATFQQMMAQWHDFRLTEVSSIANERSCCLWVSGRVTWRIKMPNASGVGGQSNSEEQVLPPYDFLTEK